MEVITHWQCECECTTHGLYTWLRIGGGQKEDSYGGFKEHSLASSVYGVASIRIILGELELQSIEYHGGGTWHKMITEERC